MDQLWSPFCYFAIFFFTILYELFNISKAIGNVMYSIVRGSTSGDDQRCACHTDQDPQLSGSFSGFWCYVLVLIFLFYYFISFLRPRLSPVPAFPLITEPLLRAGEYCNLSLTSYRPCLVAVDSIAPPLSGPTR